MRIEWCKARARALRWTEETDMLVNEMERIIIFLEWEAKRWDERSVVSLPSLEDDGELAEGYRAYALRQANLRRAISQKCDSSWQPTLMLAQRLDRSDVRLELEETPELGSSQPFGEDENHEE